MSQMYIKEDYYYCCILISLKITASDMINPQPQLGGNILILAAEPHFLWREDYVTTASGFNGLAEIEKHIFLTCSSL